MHPPRPAFSIITPTFNRAAVLLRAIRSVQAQTFADYEHLIIDDASEDDTPQLVARCRAEDPRIRYLRLERWQGANAARNAGIALARAEWLTFLDSDDEYLPHRLAELMQATQTTPCPLLLSSFRTMKRGRPRPALLPAAELTPRELEQALLTYSIPIAGSSLTVRRRTLRQAGGFDPRLRRLQDRDVLLRLAQRTGAILRDRVDWLKHPSADSISAPHRGYLAALAALVDAHPHLARSYRTLLGYHVARHLLSRLLAGRLRELIQELRENHASPWLAFSLGELLRCYRAGSAQRRAWTAELRRRPAGRRGSVTLPLVSVPAPDTATQLARAA